MHNGGRSISSWLTQDRFATGTMMPAPDGTARAAAIDMGPFFRQEGRYPVLVPPDVRRDTAHTRLRAQLGLPPARPVGLMDARSQHRPDRPATRWLTRLLASIRR
jgi:hypothetical protein